jgi:hypothetical protein
LLEKSERPVGKIFTALRIYNYPPMTTMTIRRKEEEL